MWTYRESAIGWPRASAVRAAVATLLVALPVLACGPEFPDTFLQARTTRMRTAPRASFVREVDALAHRKPGSPTDDASEPGEREATAKADLADLRLAIGGHRDKAAILDGYEKTRKDLEARAKQPGPHGRNASTLWLPPGLPVEFARYAEGAAAYHRGDATAARASFRAVLDLPEDQRRLRSTWAAYMLGRSFAPDDPAQALRWFRTTRDLARQGFTDSLGLARASLGQMGRIHLAQGDEARAAERYLEAHRDGDPWAAPSLRMIARDLFAGPASARKRALGDPTLRGVLVAHLLASDADEQRDPRSAPAQARAALLADTEGRTDVPFADRMAWLAYRTGDFKQAEAWLARASKDAPIAAWIRAKLLVRAGKPKDAARALSSAVHALPPATAPRLDPWELSLTTLDEQRSLRGELAVLSLSSGQYVEALELLLRAGSWRDAAHVAERVLTVSELRAFVDARFPEPAKPLPTGAEGAPVFDVGRELRYLLARRLVRGGHLSAALPYTPPEHQKDLGALRAALEDAASGPAAGRSAKLFAAAMLQRKQGMELAGTELGPDWHVDMGSYQEEPFDSPGKEGKLVSADERRRIRASAPGPDKRFHYRYVAAETARKAAASASNDDAKRMLCASFRWLSARDPKAAEPYAAELRRRKLGLDCAE